jgi:hypothetical protein
MIAPKRTCIEMIRKGRDEGFMVFWHAKRAVGWVVFWKQSVEKTIEFASAYKADIADLHGLIWVSWTWLPQCVSVRRIFYGKSFTEDIVVGRHLRLQLEESGELSMLLGVRLGMGCAGEHAAHESPGVQISESVSKRAPHTASLSEAKSTRNGTKTSA